MIRADLLVTRIGTLATLDRGPIPRAGRHQHELGLRRNAALAVRDGRIVWIGRAKAAAASVHLARGGERVDAEGGVVIPGLVDAHSHALFAGERSFELPWKARGLSYAEVARRGGGILATVRATRSASDRALEQETVARLARLEGSGATTIEVKSGYALSHTGELRLLRRLRSIARRHRFDLVPTYLGAHAIPPDARGGRSGYVREIVGRTLPAVARQRLAKFCDVFCEPGYFTVRESERILRAALRLGLGAKLHAEEFAWSGGARLAARLGARSVDHLLVSRPADRRALARAGVTAVLLPTTPFTTRGAQPSPGRALVDAGVPVALGSDCSPNSWVDSMGLALAHAVYGAGLDPAEAIVAATVNSAHAVGVADRAGILAVGRPADLLLYDLPTLASIPYRIGAKPARIYRQGILRSSSRVEPHL